MHNSTKAPHNNLASQLLYNTDENNKNVMFLVIFVCTSFRIHRYVAALFLNSIPVPFKEMTMGWTCTIELKNYTDWKTSKLGEKMRNK